MPKPMRKLAVRVPKDVCEWIRDEAYVHGMTLEEMAGAIIEDAHRAWVREQYKATDNGNDEFMARR